MKQQAEKDYYNLLDEKEVIEAKLKELYSKNNIPAEAQQGAAGRKIVVK